MHRASGGPRWGRRLALVAVTYYAGAQLGLSLALYNSQVTPFWPPTGIALAALLLWGRSMWPAVAVAGFAVNLPLSDDLATPVLISMGNVLAPLLAATLLRRLSFSTGMERLRDATALVGIGALSMTASATAGVGALILSGLPTSQAGSVWAIWWTGDTVGALIVAPFLLALHQQRHSPPPTRARAVEATALLLLTAVITAVGFHTNNGLRSLVFPVLAVAAVRFQLRGAAPTTLIAALIAARAGADGTGPFAGTGSTKAMIGLTLFNVSMTFTSYLLAALTADRERAVAALACQGDELERLVDDRTLALSTALGQLAQAQEIARMGSYDFDLATGQAHWSDELYRLMQMPVGSPMSMEIYFGLCHPDELDDVRTTLGNLVSTGEPFTMDHRLRRADGSYRWLHCQGQAVRDSTGTIIGTRGTATDIEDRKGAEQRFEQFVEMAPDAMVFVNDQGVITQVNLQTEELFGYPRTELVGLPLEVLIPERFRGIHPHHRQQFMTRPGRRPMGVGLELLARRRDGSEFPVEISLSPFDTAEGTLVSASIRDVTQRTVQQDELTYRGLHDALTDLPNRLLLADRLSLAVASLGRASGQHLAVVFVDVDRFKWVNDSLGHDAGDTLLRVVADRLVQAVRPEDTVARFGGDEFVVLSHGLSDPSEALVLADRLRAAVSLPVALQEGHAVVPTLSIGLTTTDDPKADPSALLRDADAAMYRAKEQGRDRTSFFAPEIHVEMSSRLATAGALRAALEQDQLRVHYQPVMSLDGGTTLAVESLVRWQHPDRGLLLPADFLALAEETGQVGALDHAAIVIACREFGQLMASRPRNAPLNLNVNVSLQHLSLARLRDTLQTGLSEGQLLPHQLTVEVTESADLSIDHFASLLTMVKNLGVRVAIDDFGTGFSSLSRLAGLEIDVIKIDRSFITDVHTSARSQSLVAAMAHLGTALGASVIAEGIELDSQAACLRRLGCTGGQGFLWSKGLPVDGLTSWLAARETPAPRRAPAHLEPTWPGSGDSR